MKASVLPHPHGPWRGPSASMFTTQTEKKTDLFEASGVAAFSLLLAGVEEASLTVIKQASSTLG